jgi:hypothetical protein
LRQITYFVSNNGGWEQAVEIYNIPHDELSLDYNKGNCLLGKKTITVVEV